MLLGPPHSNRGEGREANGKMAKSLLPPASLGDKFFRL